MNSSFQKTLRVIILVMGFLAARHSVAVLLYQTDRFDAGTMNWGSGANPVWVSTGGPAGSGDGYLQLSRPINDPFHIAAFNTSQWAGNYLSAGITAIEVDLNQIAGPDTLRIRLMLWGDGGIWASMDRTTLTAGWDHYSFGLGAADLTYVSGGSGNLSDTLSTINRIQIRHDYATPTAPGNHPEHISATMGIDNFTAVPEPSTLFYMLTATGGLMLGRMRIRRLLCGTDLVIPDSGIDPYKDLQEAWSAG